MAQGTLRLDACGAGETFLYVLGREESGDGALIDPIGSDSGLTFRAELRKHGRKEELGGAVYSASQRSWDKVFDDGCSSWNNGRSMLQKEVARSVHHGGEVICGENVAEHPFLALNRRDIRVAERLLEILDDFVGDHHVFLPCPYVFIVLDDLASTVAHTTGVSNGAGDGGLEILNF